MEHWKSIDPTRPAGREFPSRRKNVAFWVGSILIAVTYFVYVPNIRALGSSCCPSTAPPFSWDGISPSETLEYHDCGDGFQCARLEVPMDYDRSDSQNRKFALAIVRLPAKVPVEDPRYGGAVLINPGKSVFSYTPVDGLG